MKKFLSGVLLSFVGLGSAYASDGLFATAEYSHSKIEFDEDIKANFDGGAIGFNSDPREKHGYWGKFEYANSNKTDSDYYEGTLGLHYNLYQKNDFYLNGLVGLGYTRIESGVTDSNLNFVSVPLVLEAGFAATKNLDLFASVGYKWLFDMTGRDGYYGDGKTSTGSNQSQDRGKTLCADQTWFEGSDPSLCSNNGGVISNPESKVLCEKNWWSNSTGSGTCSSHGGILDETKNDGSLVGMKARYGNSISLGDAETPVLKVGLRFKF
ncbi:MAG: hypothetical protein WBG77_07230 [Acinetobacter venetianus]|uniref:hypothetical protein n=1 Tax=Acinetobacter venetianus TaxID=52133 RepID=UPI003C78EDE4